MTHLSRILTSTIIKINSNYQIYNSIRSMSSKKRKKTKEFVKKESTTKVKQSKMNNEMGEYLNKLRKWTKESKGDSAGSEGNASIQLTFMSYNVLAQDLIYKHPEYYSRHNQTSLEWKYRLNGLKNEISNIKPQILCLQEVQESHINDYVNALNELNLDQFVYKKRTSDTQTDGCAIFYNSTLFNLIEQQTVEYFQPHVDVLDRHNVGIIIKLALKSNPSTVLVVATTHLLYNPRRQDVRLAQIQVLLAELDRISRDGYDVQGYPNYVPIILTGDFNLQPRSAPYRLLTKGNLYYEQLTRRQLEYSSEYPYASITGNILLPKHLAINDHCQHVMNKDQTRTQLYHSENYPPNRINFEGVPSLDRYPFQSGTLRHQLNLSSVYCGRQYISMCQNSYWILVDYIFYNKVYRPQGQTNCKEKIKLLSYYELPTQVTCHAIGLIPNEHLPSDHLSLAAKFLLFVR